MSRPLLATAAAVLLLSAAAQAQNKPTTAPKSSQPATKQNSGHDHDHEGETKAPPAYPGFNAKKPVTRYELACTLNAFITYSDAAEKQKKSVAESKGKTSPPAPAPVPPTVRYTDIPKGHWAADAINELQKRGIVLVSGTTFGGGKSVTGAELAANLERFVARVERRKAVKGTISQLIADGYLPKKFSELAAKPITAEQATGAIALVLARSREKLIPISPDSEHAPPIDRPTGAPH